MPSPSFWRMVGSSRRATLVLALAVGCALGSAAFAQAWPSPADSAALPVASFPVERNGNLVFLPVTVNGSGPFSFLLDSGANACVIDRARAQALGIPFRETVQGTGAGKGTYDVQLIDSTQVAFGLPRLTLRPSLIAAIDLTNNLAVLGRSVDGIIGYDLFEQYVTEIDYEAAFIRLYDPSHFEHEGGLVLPLVFNNRLPHALVVLTPQGRRPVERRLLIDSGSNDAADDSVLAIATSGLIETISGVGQGKEFRSVAGRWKMVRLGSLELKDVPGGAGGVPLIGGEILRRFTVTLDFRRARLILEPNQRLREPFGWDASGIDLRLDPGSSLRVHDVAAGSPGAEAGVQTNDLLVAVDGAPTAELGLHRVRALLERPDRVYRLTLLRDATATEALVRTRERL